MVAQKLMKRKGKNRRAPKTTGSRSLSTREKVETYAGDAYSLASRTWRGLNELRKLVNIETKYLDTITTSATSQSGTVTALHLCAQGTSENTRVGNSIKVHTFKYRGVLAIHPSVSNYSTFRVIIARDMENSGVTPAGSDILEYAGASGVCVSPLNYDNKHRFGIIFDEIYQLNIQSNASMAISFKVPLEKHIEYRGSTAASTSNAEGSMFVFVFTNEPTNTGTLSISSRLEYTDD
jgi:hypothetical protein